jgi:hypothetical protein
MVLITTPRAKLNDPFDSDAKGFQLLSDDVLMHAATQILMRRRAQRSSGSENV